MDFDSNQNANCLSSLYSKQYASVYSTINQDEFADDQSIGDGFQPGKTIWMMAVNPGAEITISE